MVAFDVDSLVVSSITVDEETLKVLEALWDAADPVNDSGSYAANRTAKGMAKQMAIKALGKKV